jgi:hypothetical protein
MLRMSGLVFTNVYYVISNMASLFVVYAVLLLFTKFLRND